MFQNLIILCATIFVIGLNLPVYAQQSNTFGDKIEFTGKIEGITMHLSKSRGTIVEILGAMFNLIEYPGKEFRYSTPQSDLFRYYFISEETIVLSLQEERVFLRRRSALA